jgi:GntR family transcriptional regulator
VIRIDFSQPIYQQIIDGIIGRIVRGESRLGDQILSQREMAEALRISPNTVQRAYRDLEAMGVVRTQRGQGTFVSAPPELVASLRQKMVDKAVRRLADELSTLGFSRESIPQLVKATLDAGSEAGSADHGRR